MTSNSNANFLCLHCFKLYKSICIWASQLTREGSPSYARNCAYALPLHLSFTYVIARFEPAMYLPRTLEEAPSAVGHTVAHQAQFSPVSGLLLTFISRNNYELGTRVFNAVRQRYREQKTTNYKWIIARAKKHFVCRHVIRKPKRSCGKNGN